MSKYGNKKCIKFINGGTTTVSGIGTTGFGYGLVAETPLSFSAGVFGNGGGASPFEFSYSFWLKKDWSDTKANQYERETIYEIAKADPGSLNQHTWISVRSQSSPLNRDIQFNMERGGTADDIIVFSWDGATDSIPILNEEEKWLHFVLTFNGDMTDPASTTLYVNSVSGGLAATGNQTASASDPLTVDGEGSPDTDTGTWNWQSLGVQRPDNNISPPVDGGFPLKGKLGNFAIWNKMLSQAEVSEIYNDGRLVDLNTSTMNSNLVQWNKCGNYYGDNVNLLNNIAGGPVDVSGTFSLQRGIGYLPTYQQTLIEDPVSTDMVFMDGFDQNTSATSANSNTALDLRGWQNTIALGASSLIQRGDQKATAITAHWPKLDYSNSYVTSNKSKFLKLWPGSSAATAHGSPGSEMNEIYNTFDPVTSGTVNLGFAIRIPRNAANYVAGDLESTVCGFYWGDSNQPNPSSSLETGRFSVQFMGGTYSYLGWKPQLRRALAGDDAGTFTTVAEGPEDTFTTGGQDFTQSPLNNPIPGTDRYWYWVEAEIYPAETGSFKLYVNNSATPAINYTGDTRGVNNAEVIDFMGFRFRQTTNAGPIVIDDVVAFHNKKTTEQYCVALVPDAENFTGSFDTGSSTGVTAAADCLQSINGDLSPGSDGAIAATGTFMVTTTDPDSASFNYDNLPFTPRTIQGVQAHNLINMDGVTFTSIQNNLITGSIGLVSGSYLVQPNPGSWELVSEIYSHHPTSSVNTSQDFSSTDLDAIIDELKVK